MINPLVGLIADILLASPALAVTVRDFILGNPGATPEQLLEKLRSVKVEQAAQEAEWAKDLPKA